MLGINGRALEAEETYQAVFASNPHVPFVRYRYAIFLNEQGRRDEATQVLLALLKDKSAENPGSPPTPAAGQAPNEQLG